MEESRRSTRPTISSTVRKPSLAMCSRICSARKKKKLMTCSGWPVKRARRTGSWVAMPTEQVFRWHLRIMMQPMAMSGVVAKPNSSAPSRAAITMSRPVCNLPSVCTVMRLRRSLSSRTCWGSARPSSQGNPACLIEISGEAPVPACIARDEHHIGMRLGDAGSYCSHTDFRDQLDGNACLGIDVLEVVDELRQILDGVDVVMRRRRDQAYAGNRMAHLRDDLIDLFAGQLSAFAGLCALCHLDLQLVGVDQVIGGDAEASACHLLDSAAAQIAVWIGLEAGLVFAALAGIRHAADAIHGNGQGLVRLFTDGAEAHGPGGKAIDDFLGRFHLIQRNGSFGVLEFEQSAQGRHVAVLIIDEVRVLFECGWAVLTHRLLHLADGQRIEQMILAALAILILAANNQAGL